MKEKVLETYKVKSIETEIEVNIVEREKEFVRIYMLDFPEFGEGTEAVLKNLKKSIITDSTIQAERMMDPDFVDSLKKSFQQKAEKILDKELPNIVEGSRNLLIGLLLEEMLGLGKIEFLLNDGNIEEIVVNTASEPVWIYHKGFGWLKTNVFIRPETEIQNYASIIARRIGKQITVLNPLLDAHLITGDRANATLFPISSKGNTITIRRFRRDPYTITDFVENKTVNTDVMALIWLAMEYELNIIFSGGTGSGKTTALNICMPFIQPNQRILSIEDSVSGKSEILYKHKGKVNKTNIEELIDGLIEDDSIKGIAVENYENIEIPSMTKEGKIEWKEPSHFIRHWVKKDLMEVILASGRKIKVTPDHSLFSFGENGKIIPIKGEKLSKGTFIVTPIEKEWAGKKSSEVQKDKIEKISTEKFEGFVYDFSVPENESFIANNIVCHNTRELSLPPYLHWVPLTTREPNVEGKGEVTMLHLLINSLRMRPDRLIVGEIRRQREAEVLFEAMHTGHSAYTTVHANTAQETIRRLTNPPIEIPKTMLDSVHLNVVMFRNRRLNVRRVLQVAEFITERRGKEEEIKANVLYRWKGATDTIEKHAESIRLFDELGLHTGFSKQEMTDELKTKKTILDWLVKSKLHTIKDVGKIMANYYMDKDEIIKMVEENRKPKTGD